jgi:hypothetical protein
VRASGQISFSFKPLECTFDRDCSLESCCTFAKINTNTLKTNTLAEHHNHYDYSASSFNLMATNRIESLGASNARACGEIASQRKKADLSSGGGYVANKCGIYAQGKLTWPSSEQRFGAAACNSGVLFKSMAAFFKADASV